MARVDTVEERVGANEDAIVLLDEQNVALETLIQQGLSDIPSIQAAIDSLQLDNVNLWELTTSNAGNSAAIEAEITENELTIAALEGSLLMIQNNTITLEGSLQAQIDNNQQLALLLQEQANQINDMLDFQQNLADGICEDGSAVQQILAKDDVKKALLSGEITSNCKMRDVSGHSAISLNPATVIIKGIYQKDGTAKIHFMGKMKKSMRSDEMVMGCEADLIRLDTGEWMDPKNGHKLKK